MRIVSSCVMSQPSSFSIWVSTWLVMGSESTNTPSQSNRTASNGKSVITGGIEWVREAHKHTSRPMNAAPHAPGTQASTGVTNAPPAPILECSERLLPP
ncbi:hypothetical protein G6F24_017245 [Rhizopus arrhizus]|nr:hypothetical protein G6F24_017245 [Rhizopus arrhizus]